MPLIYDVLEMRVWSHGHKHYFPFLGAGGVVLGSSPGMNLLLSHVPGPSFIPELMIVIFSSRTPPKLFFPKLPLIFTLTNQDRIACTSFYIYSLSNETHPLLMSTISKLLEFRLHTNK